MGINVQDAVIPLETVVFTDMGFRCIKNIRLRLQQADVSSSKEDSNQSTYSKERTCYTVKKCG